METWRLRPRHQRGASRCCPLHIRIKELRRCMKRLEKLQCKPEFFPARTAQCLDCGVVGDWDESDDAELVPCSTCGQCQKARVFVPSEDITLRVAQPTVVTMSL